MEWNEVAQEVLLVFVAVALALFARERHGDRLQQLPEERTISGVFLVMLAGAGPPGH